jgi:hypothetical protein
LTAGAPSFLITIDTEGDNLWASPQEITTRNARHLPRFQSLCERYGYKPTYLTNYEMAMDGFFADFGRDAIRRGTAEIGMHLHAWNSPPIVPLTTDDFRYCPYLIEYPEPIMDEKIAFMTNLLEDTFGVKMVSHRAGRWAFNAQYARLLVRHGYKVDCSVVPGFSWRKHTGAPNGAGGTDYRRYPKSHYFIDMRDISRAGNSPLLEVPMTVLGPPLRSYLPTFAKRNLVTRITDKFVPPYRMLRTDGTNIDSLLSMIERSKRAASPYMEFMLHSSEFMAGGSPTFPDADSIETLFRDLESLFESASQYFAGATLGEYRQQVEAAGLVDGTKA